MDSRFLAHNSHLEDVSQFVDRDPQLRRLKSLPYIYTSNLLNEFPVDEPGIYTLTGGRQVGKTTLLKQWMHFLLTRGIPAQQIVFFSGELIEDRFSLLRLFENQLSEMNLSARCYFILDEVTYIREWEKIIKYLADSGLLENVILLVAGSDTVLLQKARISFPGRRGKADKNDFHFYPLSFYEYVCLTKKDIQNISIDKLFEAFNEYLIHGGYLTAINDMAQYGYIKPATLLTYSDWIRGDCIKHGKHEHYLREIIRSIIEKYDSQVSWNALARNLSIDHPKTVADYIELLASMDAVFIQHALKEDKLVQAPKKAKKVMFCDPFIYHSMRYWLDTGNDPFNQQILPLIKDPVACGKLVEATIATHYRRYYPTYYIKAEAEVDIAYLSKKKFWPVEVKWTTQNHMKNLKQIVKYNNGIILTKSAGSGEIRGVPTEPIPIALMKLHKADGS